MTSATDGLTCPRSRLSHAISNSCSGNISFTSLADLVQPHDQQCQAVFNRSRNHYKSFRPFTFIPCQFFESLSSENSSCILRRSSSSLHSSSQQAPLAARGECNPNFEGVAVSVDWSDTLSWSTNATVGAPLVASTSPSKFFFQRNGDGDDVTLHYSDRG
ncbi:hypothetical protein IW261DRAFT_419985 [Armillaria novae-zelandiae]|uniref:Uncharacterized protein n=1 Tax=Armillaria novae-zelandiae TaxID=153914 RepID=A0AA39U2U5_9AGAR|nr:hypothetical protein IW261DRAFT_419985 [Armillaria novae-zelandiae]